MPSIVDLAELSQGVYSLAPSVMVQPFGMCTINPPCWHRGATWNPFLSGFTAAAYRLDANNNVLAFAGTDSLWDALVDDADIAVGMMPPQTLRAISAAKACGGYRNLYLTGHSLGGALAIIAAAHTGLPAVSFNAPGVFDSCVVSSRFASLRDFLSTVARCYTGSRIMNIRIDGDPVSSFFTTGVQTGAHRQQYPGASCGLDALCRHGIATVISQVRAVANNFDPLNL